MRDVLTSICLILVGQALQSLRSHYADQAERSQRNEQTALLRRQNAHLADLVENTRTKIIG